MAISSVARTSVCLAIMMGAIAIVPGGAAAQEDGPELGWFYTAEASGIWTGGNSVATTLGFGATIRRIWETTVLDIRGGGLRTNTGTVTRTAVGTLTDFDVTKNTDTDVTAENYFLRGRVDRALSETFFYYGGAGWERNTFAGFDSRISAVAGVGNTWLDDETTRFKTTYGVTFTQQDDVIDNPDISDSFLGARLGAEFWRQLTSNTTFESIMIADENFSDFEDLRVDWLNAIEVAMNDVLALKAGFQILFDNQPALTEIALEQPAGTPTGELVTVPLGEWDTQFTIALVASW